MGSFRLASTVMPYKIALRHDIWTVFRALSVAACAVTYSREGYVPWRIGRATGQSDRDRR